MSYPRSIPHRQPSILIVDDESIIRDLCAKALPGYQITQASNGEEALQLFHPYQFDCVLTDIMMPQLNGIDLLRRIKEVEPTQVVIVMTGYAEKEVILNALKADADDFITKPLNLIQLKTTVDRAIEKRGLKDEIANLRSLDRLKSNFLSLVSHKFRTPLTTISLFLQNLAGGIYDLEDPTFRRNLSLISDETHYLEQLVADLLLFTRAMESGDTLQLTPTDLPGIIGAILAESQEVVRKPGIRTRLDLAPLAPLPLDQSKITFALRQVLDNAYKFSLDQGGVAITLKEEGGQLLLTVADQGIGISRNNLLKVFEKFYQVDPANSGQVRGFGLGLFYARHFITLHGGNITLTSEVGAGTTVTITLPLTPVSSP
ncbi:MAG TPA: response regulator [Geobacterales bacterium]|nr:response regulator [Geobacterales bacterium]